RPSPGPPLFPYTTLFRSGLPAPFGGRAGIEEALAVDAGSVDRDMAVAEHDQVGGGEAAPEPGLAALGRAGVVDHGDAQALNGEADRKSTRLNSSHDQISY